MKKKINDYLHLYIGCMVQYPGLKNPRHMSAKWMQSLIEKGISIKPILRSLSDITEEEADHFAWMCMNSRHHLDKDCQVSKDEIEIELAKCDNATMVDGDVEIYIGVACRCFEGAVIIGRDGSIYVVDEDGKKQQPIDDTAFKIHWLLSKHFDLFGLIGEKLAIDKTTLNDMV